MSLTTGILIVGTLGAVWGLLLSLVARKMHVHGNHTMEKISVILPGTDCRACGFNTCRAYATAVAGHQTVMHGCAAGGPKIAHAIGDILQTPVTMPEQMVAVVHCKGGRREALDSFEYEGIADCHAMMIAGNGGKLCPDGCLGLGSCVRACPFGALRVTENQVAVVASDRCTGCGRCLSVCPRSLLELIPRVHNIYLACANHDHGAKVKKYCSVGCTACTLCVEATPSGAITMRDNLPVLDYAGQENYVVACHKCPSDCFVDLVRARPKVNIDVKCNGCGACRPICPVGAINGQKGHRHVIDKDRCIGCGVCLNVCPTRAIALWGGLVYRNTRSSR